MNILKSFGIQPKRHPSCTFTYWVHGVPYTLVVRWTELYGMGKLTRFKGMEESFEVNHFQVHGWSSDGCPEEVTSTVELINMLNSGCLNSSTGIGNV